MPIYVYEHEDARDERCEDPFERLHSASDPPLARCPLCANPVRRVPSRFGAPRDVLAASRIKERGFTRLKRRDAGAYEAD